MDIDTIPEKQALIRAAKVVGGQAELARLLGFANRSGVSPWFRTRRAVPAEYCPAIEELTASAGVRVRCEELRPDVKWSVLRAKRVPAKA